MLRSVSSLLALLLFVAGCSPEDASVPKDPTKGAGAEAKPKKKETKSEPPEEEDRSRTTLAGRWQLMTIGREATEAPLVLVDVSMDEEAKATLVAQAETVRVPLSLEEVKIDGNAFSFGLKGGETGATFRFAGKLDKGVVVGTMVAGPKVAPARLIATKATSLKEPRQYPLPGRQEFAAAMNAQPQDRTKKLKEFLEKYPHSLLAIEARQQVFMAGLNQKLPEAEVADLVEKLLQEAEYWGPELRSMTEQTTALGLTQLDMFPDITLRLVDDLEKKAEAKETKDETQAELFRQLRKAGLDAKGRHERQARFEAAKKQLAGDDAEAQKEARAALEEITKDEPLNPFFLEALARDAEKEKRTDEAIEWYARLVAWPALQEILKGSWGEEKRTLPSDALAALWKEKHGSDEGLDAHLQEVYRSKLFAFAQGEKPPERKVEGEVKHTVLVELFTGSTSPAGVAADLALGGIERLFDPSDVVPLRYHQNSSGPDQLANGDSETRFHDYGGRDTPVLMIDGRQFGPLIGSTPDAPRAYRFLRDVIEKAFEVKTTVTLKLSAEAKDGELILSAEANGVPRETEGVRLRMAIVEEQIPFVAGNGLRLHDMVVRAMPGSPKGVAPTADGALKFSKTIKLDDFRLKLSEELAALEERNPNVDLKQKPLALEKLRFVAFVQNDETHEVLQTAVVPVTGTIEYGKGKKKPAE